MPAPQREVEPEREQQREDGAADQVGDPGAPRAIADATRRARYGEGEQDQAREEAARVGRRGRGQRDRGCLGAGEEIAGLG